MTLRKPSDQEPRARRILPNSGGIGPAVRLRVLSTIVAVQALLACGVSAVADEPAATGFVMQDRAPFAALIGIPGRWPNTSDNFAELAWNASSHAMAEISDGFTVFADGETHTLTARMQIEAWRRWRVGVQLPWIKHSSGFLDSTIDTWHEVFGLNEGIRPKTGKNQLDYILQQQGANLFWLSDSVSGVGDLQLGMTGELGSFGRYAQPDTLSEYFLRVPWRLALNIKLPTGDIDKLTGSGNTDIAAGIGWRAPDKAGAKLRWWLDLGVVFAGDVDIDGLETEPQVYYYDAAMTWRIVRSFDAILQVAGHSRLYTGNVSALGDSAAQLAIGGLWHLSPRLGLRFGIFEDIVAESTTDFGVEVSLLIRRW